MGEHYAIDGLSGTFLPPPRAPQEHGGECPWVDGTLTMFIRGEKAVREQTGFLPASLLGCPSLC